MTKSQGNAAVVSREKTTKRNKTSQIKFSYTSVSRLHVSHLSIIYRRPQRAVAELVRAGGSKLGSRRRGGSRWSVVVRTLVLKASRRVGGGGSCYSVLVVVVVEDFRVGVPSSPGLVTCQSRDAGGQDRWQQPHRVSGCGPNVLFSKFSMDGAFEWKRNFSQSPSWMVVVVVVVVRGGAGGVFSLLTMEDQTAEHLVSCQESPRPWPRPLGDGERHENSWTPGKLWPVPTGLAASASVCGNVGSGVGAVATLEMLESQAGWGDKIQPHPWVLRPAPPRPSRNFRGTGRLVGTGPETTEAPFTSSGPGRWRTPSETARAWGPAAWGPG